MLVLCAILLLLWLSLIVFLWGGSIWLQAYLYSEPAEQLFWRAPLAGTILTLGFGLWCFLDYRHPESVDTLLRFNVDDEKQFDEFWVEKDNQKIHYRKTIVPRGNMPGQIRYRDAAGQFWTRSDAIVVQENSQDVRFVAERDKNNNYRTDPGKGLLYRDARGREMSEEAMGRVSTFRWGMLLLNLALNLFHLVLWFLCLWLCLRYQWPHALGLASVFWLATTLVLLPMILTQASAEGSKRVPEAVGKEVKS